MIKALSKKSRIMNTWLPFSCRGGQRLGGLDKVNIQLKVLKLIGVRWNGICGRPDIIHNWRYTLKFSVKTLTSLTIICCQHGHCLKLHQSNPVTQGFSSLLNPIKKCSMLITNAFDKDYRYWLKKSLPSYSAKVFTVMLFFGHRSTLVLYFMLFAYYANLLWFLGKDGLVSAFVHVFFIEK